MTEDTIINALDKTTEIMMMSPTSGGDILSVPALRLSMKFDEVTPEKSTRKNKKVKGTLTVFKVTVIPI